jgi:hypothetical protein
VLPEHVAADHYFTLTPRSIHNRAFSSIALPIQSKNHRSKQIFVHTFKQLIPGKIIVYFLYPGLIMVDQRI